MNCPECDGQQLLNHPKGELTFQHRLDCSLLTAEDATSHADHLRLGAGPFSRSSTETERLLLGWLGYQVEAGLLTRVERITNSVTNRTWTDLKENSDA